MSNLPCQCADCRAGLREPEAAVTGRAYGRPLCAPCQEKANESLWQERLSGRPDPFRPVEANPVAYGLWRAVVADHCGRQAVGGGFGLLEAMENARIKARAGRWADLFGD